MRLAHALRDADEADVRAALLGAAAEVQAVRHVRAAGGNVAGEAAALLAKKSLKKKNRHVLVSFPQFSTFFWFFFRCPTYGGKKVDAV